MTVPFFFQDTKQRSVLSQRRRWRPGLLLLHLKCCVILTYSRDGWRRIIKDSRSAVGYMTPYLVYTKLRGTGIALKTPSPSFLRCCSWSGGCMCAWFRVAAKEKGVCDWVSAGVQWKTTGELCCGAIRASGYTHNRSLTYCSVRIEQHCCSSREAERQQSPVLSRVSCVFSVLLPDAQFFFLDLSFSDLEVALCAIRSGFHLSCHVTSTYGSCQVRMLPKMHRIHSVTSRDEMSRINPHHCTHLQPI